MTEGPTLQSGLRDFGESLALYRLWLHRGYAEMLGRYRRTALGPLWHTLSLAVFVVVTGILWATIMKVELPRYMMFLTAGLVVWGFISASIVEGCNVLIAAEPIALSTRIPYPMLPMGHVWRLFLVFLHQLPLCALATWYFGGSASWSLLLLVPGTIIVAISAFWMSLLMGLFALRFRDASVIVSNAMNIAMFATPVFWTKDLLGPQLAHLADWNPLFHLVEIMRLPILGQEPSDLNWTVSIGWMAVGLVVTMLIYSAVRHRIAYWF